MLVKVTPPGEPDVTELEPLTMRLTVDRAIDVREFKSLVSTRLGGRGPFRLCANEELLRDEQGLQEALQLTASQKKPIRWAKPYEGKRE